MPAHTLAVRFPTAETLIASLAAGVLTVLIHTTFGIPAPWLNYCSVALVALATLGINPVVGSAFTNAIHASPALVATISSILGAAAILVTQVGLSSMLVGIVQGLVAVAGGLGFGTRPPAAMRKFVSL